ncbi:MAG: hypothetical protein JJT75_08500, partial [Opitutales bacterium]|nr:hypothetical protein [Opitutales bacterium]
TNAKSLTYEQRHAAFTARSLRGARCGKTARRDLQGGSSATASPTLMPEKNAVDKCLRFC